MNRNTVNVLLIEDDPEDANLIKRILGRTETMECRLKWARSGNEAFELAEKESFDIILLDFQLLRETAKDVISNLSQRLVGLAVIILTGLDSDVVEEESFGLGVDFFLGKQRLNLVALERTMRYAIRNREQQNRLRNFARFVAHDLNGLVGHVAGSLQLLKEDLCDIGHEQKELLQIAVNECGRISKFIKELHAFSVSQDGQLEYSEISFKDILIGTLNDLAPEIKSRNVHIKFDGLPECKVDSGLVQHVVQNLIENSIKYNRQQRPEIKVSGFVKNRICTISFQDNGVGIHPSLLNKVFQPFVRAREDDEFGGTGLGLAICKEIINRHGGRIWVESTGVEGEGAQFFIQLPTDVGTRLPLNPMDTDNATEVSP